MPVLSVQAHAQCSDRDDVVAVMPVLSVQAHAQCSDDRDDSDDREDMIAREAWAS